MAVTNSGKVAGQGSAGARLSADVTGFHHACRTVEDMETALGFYRDLLGLEVILDEELGGAALDRATGLDGTAARVVELGASGRLPYLELLEYRSPPGKAVTSRPCDPGAHHVAFAVSDIQASYELLSSEGVPFTCPPQEIAGGGFEGDWTAYCLDPEQMIVELWQSRSRSSSEAPQPSAPPASV